MKKATKFWDRMSKRMDRADGKLSPTALKTIEQTKKYLKNNDIVLDYGCGTGSITRSLAEQVREVQGVDISEGMIAVARQKSAGLNRMNISFTQADLFDKQYSINSYDAILAFNVLHYSTDINEVVERINYLLKPGGLFISSTAMIGDGKTIISRFLSFTIRLGLVPKMIFFKLEEFIQIICSANFKIIESKELSELPDCFVVVQKVE